MVELLRPAQFPKTRSMGPAQYSTFSARTRIACPKREAGSVLVQVTARPVQFFASPGKVRMPLMKQ